MAGFARQWAISVILLCFISRDVCALELAVYVDSDFGFRVEYPKDWRRMDLSGTDIRLFVESADVDVCFFNVSSVPKSKEYELSKLVPPFLEGDTFERILRKSMPEARVQSVQRTRFGNQDAVFATFTNVVEAATLRENQRGFGILTWHNGYSYGGTCIASPERFEATAPIFKAILATFLFLP